MNVLTIDTSNQVMGVAILQDEIVIGEIVTNITKNHSVRLMPAINQLMEEVSMTPDQLDKIVVAKGPGSYTGVRIGLSTAKSMAWALDIPVVGVSSLEILAYHGQFFNGYICPFFDARRGLVYTGIYQWQDQQLISVDEEKNILMVDVLDRLANENQEVLFLSPDLSLHLEQIKEVLGEKAVIPAGPYHIPNPSFLGLAGLSKEVDNTHTLTPNYLRLAEAEANWLKAQKGKR
ncbi:tRNA (adenosine(37)-N6)-threonylcarbamoyltransferase complex dimerization subunit type 1 TsaB [Oceanobacillus senegalensis]|uniref:tRNA (adenosine(37)-N6)-threonylcarbamoyltransferase complex dimerization subunit type 1 TsaB n=1 Tax=Oceanobacillus senegalensis TaxID=1936063 RepID=UPI000A3055DB|nr:tRNA (adenosine(37)-N6)-threonylcarbamoyltransferase complex dimerization subunit type 1 TsaB [Oceanobacillus senegalensis]